MVMSVHYHIVPRESQRTISGLPAERLTDSIHYTHHYEDAPDMSRTSSLLVPVHNAANYIIAAIGVSLTEDIQSEQGLEFLFVFVVKYT